MQALPSFEANVVPTIQAATHEATVTLSASALQDIIANAVKAALGTQETTAPVTEKRKPGRPPGSKNKTPVVQLVAPQPVVPQPVQPVAPQAKQERAPRGVSVFAPYGKFMLVCQDGEAGATKTNPPVGTEFRVLIQAKAIIQDGQAVMKAAEIRRYSPTKAWKRNQKDTGWVTHFPKNLDK
jgi:hypothetical protein